MGRTVLLEDSSIQSYVSSHLLGRVQWQAGLLVGLSGFNNNCTRDYVLRMVPTPTEDDDDDDDMNYKNTKSNQSCGDVGIDNVWMLEHARQITSMLPGGLSVIGVYAFGPPEVIQSLQTSLRKLLFNLSEHSLLFHRKGKKKDNMLLQGGKNMQHRILLNLCCKTCRYTVLTFDISDPRSTAKPAEVKHQAFVNRLHSVTSNIGVPFADISVPTCDIAATAIRECAEASVSSYHNSLIVIDGSAMCYGYQEKSGNGNSDIAALMLKKQVHSAELFIVPVSVSETNTCLPSRIKEYGSIVSLSGGTMVLKGYTQPKATVEEVAAAIREDAVRSLWFRCNTLANDLEESQKEGKWVLPRRLLFPLLHGISKDLSSVDGVDYIFTNETPEDCTDRLSVLFGFSDIHEKDLNFIEPASSLIDITENSKVKLMSTSSDKTPLTTISTSTSSNGTGSLRIHYSIVFVTVAFIIAVIGVVTQFLFAVK